VVHRTAGLIVALATSAGPGLADVEYALTYERIDPAGEWARALDAGLAGELAVRADHGRWVPGLAVRWGSHEMPAPDDGATWSHIALLGTIAMRPWPAGAVVPVAEARVGWVRLRRESTIFLDDPDRELEPGENPFEAENGIELSLLVGARVPVRWGVALEVGASIGVLRSQEADLTPVGKSSASSATPRGLRVGIGWGR